jgi:hypothetical protein
MKRCCNPLILSLMVALPHLVVGADSPSPIVDLTISNGARLIQHFHDSIYSKVWSSPSLAAVRAKLDEVKPQAQEQLGFDPFAVLEGLASARLQVSWEAIPGVPPADAPPEILLQIDLGAQALVLFHGLIDKLPLPATTIAGADEAILLPDGAHALARFGTVLAVGKKEKVHKPDAVPATEHDVSFHLDGAALATAIRAHVEEPDAKAADQILAILKPYAVPIQADFDLVADGMMSTSSVETTVSWLTPVDRSFFGQLPLTVYSCSAFGLDGQALWKDLIKPLLGVIAEKDGNPPDQAETMFNTAAAAAGLTVQLADLVGGLKGTFFAATSPGAPIPGITIGIPRSPALDQVVTFALKQLQNEPPAEGMSTSIIIPNVPVPINLIRSAAAWVITSDATLASSWGGDPTSAWSSTPLGKLAAAKVDAEVNSFSLSDTPTELRSMQGYLAMGMAAVPLEPPVKQAIINGLSQVIAQSGLSYQVSKQGKKRLTSEGRGLFGMGSMSGIAVVAIGASLIIPKVMERKSAAVGPADAKSLTGDAAAAAALKSAVFPAEVQFQAGSYHDHDKSGIADFGFFGEMAGGPIPGRTDNVTLSLLPAPWKAVSPVINDYQFSVYIPDGKGGAMSAADDHPITDAQKDKRPDFVAYAWPVKAIKGSHLLAITTRGTVYAIPFKDGDPAPAWNALFGGKGWQDPIVWEAFKRKGQNAAPKSQTPPAAKPKPGGATDF